MENNKQIASYFECDNQHQHIDLYGMIYKTPIGDMLCLSGKDGIVLLEFTEQSDLLSTLNKLKNVYPKRWVYDKNSYLQLLINELDAYFAGSQYKFTVPLQLHGTPFQIDVWNTLKNIPYGEYISYKEQAQLMGNEKAIRAIANSNGKNKIAIVIPCHRVIGSNGSMTGYAGGVWRKQFLLELERKSYKASQT